MVDKEKLEQSLASLMDAVEVCEGLIAADNQGNIIVGQTLTEMDHKKIALDCVNLINNCDEVGTDISKGKLQDITLNLEDGFLILVGSEQLILIALAGNDALSSLALIRRNLINVLRNQ